MIKQNEKKISDDRILQEDLERLVYRSSLLNELSGQTVFVTGATGLIGSQIVKTLALYNYIFYTNIKIIALVRNEKKAKKIFSELLSDTNIIICIGDINKAIEVGENIDYIIHGASITSSKSFVNSPVETIMTAIMGTRNILELAKNKSVKGFIYLSSLEVYGTPQKEGFIEEADYGYIDPLNVRSSYSEGKKMVECLCVSYATQYNIPVKIARLSQTFGAGVEYNDGRVFAEFARCAIEGKNIVLHTEGKTVRSYCYTSDAINAIFYILLKGKKKEAYNVTNMETVISIRDMAQLVCQLNPDKNMQVEYDMPENIDSFGYNPEMIIKLDSSKLMNLGWKPVIQLREMFQRLIDSMKNGKNNFEL